MHRTSGGALWRRAVEEKVSTMLHVLQNGIDLENVRAPGGGGDYAPQVASKGSPHPHCCGATNRFGPVRGGVPAGAADSLHQATRNEAAARVEEQRGPQYTTGELQRELSVNSYQ